MGSSSLPAHKSSGLSDQIAPGINETFALGFARAAD
jgi:hypothetical protein